MKIFAWLQSVYSEQDGVGSAARVALHLVAAGCLLLGFLSLLLNRDLQPNTLAMLLALIGAAIGGYAANRLTNRTPERPNTTEGDKP